MACIVILRLHQNHCFTKTTLTPPISHPIIMPPKSQSQPLNPNAEPFYPRQRWRVSEKRNRNWRNHHNVITTRIEWRVKKVPKGDSTSRSRRTVIPFPNTIKEAEDFRITTVMIRNVPNQYNFEDLLLILDEHCFEQNKTADDPADWSKFDFLYLPMDFRKHALEKRMSNLGYAFVNFTTPKAAFKFYKQFHGFVWNVNENRKTCEINKAEYQGKDNLMRIFSQKLFRCDTRDFLPFVFSEARDGLNRRVKGTPVGKHIWGLPKRSIGNRAFSFQNQ